MKKSIVAIAIAISLFSCNKAEEKTTSEKTAYIDTVKLMDEYTESKDLQAKFEEKSKVMGRELELEIKKFQDEADNFRRNAQANGPEWAQRKGAELQKKEQQLTYAQQAMSQQLQKEAAVERDSVVSKVRKYIKDYGKKNGYSYIYGTGDAATVLYAKEGYDITEKIVKELNDNYKAPEKTETKDTAKAEEKK
ncbi:OmpH family outer membrane protein [Flavobacterium microcysteis]|uniref:OmpH family outer membrane protein n=1 Tax=Flavobacterium microcysteis TaxID=2596891 RepID=A0A501QIW1_9FLAO|nr:OmpH family outer membrane protein [Flavobacterium microcysteis]TPD71926.1 OmpH family outer membrane protein [Flavobacterium microcysteis]